MPPADRLNPLANNPRYAPGDEFDSLLAPDENPGVGAEYPPAPDFRSKRSPRGTKRFAVWVIDRAAILAGSVELTDLAMAGPGPVSVGFKTAGKPGGAVLP